MFKSKIQFGIDSTKENGGYTFDSNFESYKREGFVATALSYSFDADEISPEMILDIKDNHSDILDNPLTSIGLYKMSETEISVDINFHFNSKNDAIKFGKMCNQFSIGQFDSDGNYLGCIKCGGNGKGHNEKTIEMLRKENINFTGDISDYNSPVWHGVK